MIRSVLITSALLIGCVTAKAQYHSYKPLPIPSSDNNNVVPPSYRKENNSSELQRVNGYVINASTQSIRKISLLVAPMDRSLVVTGMKELQDNSWTTFSVNKPVVQKLSYGEAFSNQFEYKVYIPSLAQTVYF